MSADRVPRVPPRWVVRTAWVLHRAIYRASGGRLGLSRPEPGNYGTLRLQTLERRRGETAVVVLEPR